MFKHFNALQRKILVVGGSVLLLLLLIVPWDYNERYAPIFLPPNGWSFGPGYYGSVDRPIWSKVLTHMIVAVVVTSAGVLLAHKSEK